MAKELSIIDQLKFTKGSLVEQKVAKVKKEDLLDVIATKKADEIVSKRKQLIEKTLNALEILRNKQKEVFGKHTTKQYVIFNDASPEDTDSALENKVLSVEGQQEIAKIQKLRNDLDSKLNDALDKMNKESWQSLEDLLRNKLIS